MKQDFFKDFDKVDKTTWVEQATDDLKGENPLEKFKWSLEPDLTVRPYYSEEDLDDIKTELFQNRLYKKDHPSGKIRHWDNLQEIEIEDVKRANDNALNALENGADGIIFIYPSEKIDLSALLKDIKAQYCTLWFKNAPIDDLAKLNKITDGHFNLFYSESKQLTEALQSGAKKVAFDTYVNQETNFTDQISELLKHSANLAEEDTVSVNDFFKKNSLPYQTSTDFFGDIAAMRALRQLYFQVARAFDAADFQPEDLHIIGISSPWTNEAYNPHANMLKGTTAGMAAVLGGCNSLLIRPESTEKKYMTRVARNVSNMLKEESYFDSNSDPVAGSYYLENLTQELAKKAWSKFQQKVTEK